MELKSKNTTVHIGKKDAISVQEFVRNLDTVADCFSIFNSLGGIFFFSLQDSPFTHLTIIIIIIIIELMSLFWTVYIYRDYRITQEV